MLRQPSQERGCDGKANLGRRYQANADRIALRHGKRYGVYRCPHCGGTHLTTKLDNADQYKPLLYVTPCPASATSSSPPARSGSTPSARTREGEW